MSKTKNKTKFFQNIEITDFAGEGKSVARIDDLVVFVEGAIPGDIIDLRITEVKKNYMVAVQTKLHQPSVFRTEAFCEHFGTCGGCKWQHLQYQKQLDFKQQQVVDNLTRIGKLVIPSVQPILASPFTKYYRNKLDFTFTDTRWLTTDEISAGKANIDRRGLGFHIPRQYDKVLDIKQCYLQPEPSNAIRLALKDFAWDNNLSFYDLREKKGFFRSLVIRNTEAGEVMVTIQFGENNIAQIHATLDFLKNKFPQITSLNYIINQKLNDTFADLDIVCYHGLPYITERMENLAFRIGVKSFYQTNPSQAYHLYKVARNLAGLTGKEIVYDLYTGTGTIALFVAQQAKKVIGIEYVAEAIEDAKINAQINQINNTDFYAGDMKYILNTDFIARNGKPDVIITDPPRPGMHEDVIKVILLAAPQKIVYVSCNPATQARDLALMSDFYEVKYVQPVDMFPHTFHVENVVLLERK
jgi:23S rRNA (uracil1939-C5)-methyltransferase